MIRRLSLLFGGRGHSTFLGCLSCSRYDPDSVFHTYGTYGSQYSANSIFNRFGRFGSAYSAFSACNPFATDPPVIVDGGAGFYGRLTLNRSHRQAIRDEQVLGWLAAICAS